jgi:predicted amidophosphoribosyltransferase
MSLWDGVLAVLIAPVCAACERPLARPSRQVVCDACWIDVRPITPPFCERCGDALASWRTACIASGVCPRCRRSPPGALDGRRAAGIYDGRLRQIIQAWKYDRRRSLVVPLAQRVRTAARDLCERADAVVPVPLHPRRARQRGFNQAADLARQLGPPVLMALRRIRRTPPQVTLAAARRRRNVRGAFALAPAPWGRVLREMRDRGARLLRSGPRVELTRSLVAGRHLLLVDDVCTTGATLEACAQELKRAGAASVRAVTAARAVPARPR